MNKQFLLFTILAVFLFSCETNKESVTKAENLIESVDPFIGTGGHGHTYPGASTPFGMVQLSPDTRLVGWDGCSGYHISDSIVYGFSHTHLSGTGCTDYGDILLMPTTGEILINNGSDENKGYSSVFSHDNEISKPGYYSTLLDDYNIKVELTATKRVGYHKYTFPKSENSHVIIDLLHRDKVKESSFNVVSETEVEGMRRSDEWASNQVIFFVAKFSKPFKDYNIALDEKFLEGESKAVGENIKASLNFITEENEEIIVTVGISAVSIEGARKNLEAETKDITFEIALDNAEKAWNKSLSKIVVEGGTEDQNTIFYTSMYHSLLNPNLFMDVDGSYYGTDHKVHQANNFENYTVFSLWDTYRATHPLFTIIEQKRTNDFINTFLAQYNNGGQLPVWELAGNYTGCMIGYHSIPVITDAYMKGIRDYDVEKVYEAMKHSAELDHHGLEFYKAKGYIPASDESESVSKTLEYAYDGWCIAQMAKALGKDDDYKTYMKRAQSFKNVFDKSTGFMRAKLNETWFAPFDPSEVNFNYTEANSWQYSFYVPQDVTGFISLLGGKDKLDSKLDALFSAKSETTGREQADITGLIGQYAHGNEPSHHMAYLYNYVNKPWKSQKILRQIMNELYTTLPDGLSGNEDCGQMSSWYVLSSLGFYPVTPGQDIYAIGTPIFPKATINLESGNQFVVKANNVSDKNFYIQSATLNGEEYTKSFLSHKDIMNGGELVFEMGETPNKDWGSSDNDIPVSEITDNVIIPVPFIETGSRTFIGSTEITLATVTEGAKIYYTIDGSVPTMESEIFSEPFQITATTKIKAFSFVEGMPISNVITAEFNKIKEGRTIEIISEYENQYSAGGDMALIDHIRGPGNYRTGAWQGFQGKDLEVIVNLGSVQEVNMLSASFIQDIGSWIFMPTQVEYYISNDGKNFKKLKVVENDLSIRQLGTNIESFKVDGLNISTQYVKVIGKSIIDCPDWHKGYGGKAWLFSDEIIIE